MGETKSVLHDATPSWNGYNYQGKVGLYVCLVNILREAQAGVDLPSFDIFLNEHHLEYEWIEDFAIKKNRDYLSLHQVKHKGENKFKDHVEAISTILYRKNGVISDTDIFKYFKFKSKKKGDTKAAQTLLKSEITNHKLIDGSGLLASNWKVNVQAVDIMYRDSITKCFSDFELLVQKAFGSSATYFHTADKVDSPVDDIPTITGIPGHLISGLVNSKSLSCQGIHLSFDNSPVYDLALSDDELTAKLEQQIKEILELLHSGTTFLDADIKLYKTALCSLIDQNIVTRHQHIRDKRDNHIPYLQRTKPSISFRVIVSELQKTFREQNDDYWNLICRENFETAYKEQLDELYQNIKESASEQDVEEYRQYVVRLESVRINIIDQYFPDDCIRFLKQIYPHKILTSNIRKFHDDISNTEDIKSIFFDFIQEITAPSGKLTLNCHSGFFQYQPSCINFNKNSARRKKIEIEKAQKGLADNHGNKSNVFKNVDYIVVSSNDINDVIPAGIEKITEVDAYISTPLGITESDKYTNEKEIHFIDSRKALGEING